MRRLSRTNGVFTIMDATQALKLSVLKALHADGEAADTASTKLGKSALFHRTWISLKSDFDIWRKSQPGTQG